ncbi:MAG: hypothetical protein LUC93_16465 [Planctomycetaceae bacterium]|nr:hypothetical protein [Planctomycetaceae bacterium]
MIWITRTLDFYIPPSDLVDAFANDVRLDGVLYRKLTRPMFDQLRADKEVRKSYPGKVARLVAAIFDHNLENIFYDIRDKRDNQPA